jgi:dynein heavy chain, axonemal
MESISVCKLQLPCRCPLLKYTLDVQALEMKHMQLLMTYGAEVTAVTDIFNYNREKPIVPKNAARHSGSIKWVRGLVERIEAPMEKIRCLNKAVLDTEEARAIFASQGALVQAMKEFEDEHVKAWISKVSQVRGSRDSCPL